MRLAALKETGKRRRSAALAAAKAVGLEALLVTHLPDVRWLTGFTGSSAAVALTVGESALFTDGRYAEQAQAESPGIKVVIDRRPPGVQAAEFIAGLGIAKCGFDATQTTVAAMDAMKKGLPGKARRSFLVSTNGIVARLREVKDAAEVAQMRKAASLGCALFSDVLEFLEPGATESEVALALEVKARMEGAEGMSFETIVASGARSALPHGRATPARLPKRGFVTLDFGIVLGGYCSDMTRTVHMGKAKTREWDVYHSVLEAQQAAVAAVRPGITCGEVDEAARAVLRKVKLAKWFTHSTGHGVGIEIHEGPRIAVGQQQVLEPGMVITIEPGVYLPGKFGVRIEDMVLVTAKAGEVLTGASPKAWIEL